MRVVLAAVLIFGLGGAALWTLAKSLESAGSLVGPEHSPGPELGEIRVLVETPATMTGTRIQGWMLPGSSASAPAWRKFLSSGTSSFSRGTPHELSWSGLEPGRYWVAIAYAGQTAALWAEEVEVDARAVSRSINLREPEFPGYREVHLLGPDPESLRHLEWQTRHDQFGEIYASTTPHVVRTDGTYLVCVAEILERTGGTHMLEVLARGTGRALATFDPTKNNPIELHLKSAASLRVDITGAVGSRYQRRLMVGWDPAGPLTLSEASRLDAKGGHTITGVQPGAGEVVLFANTRMRDSNPVARHAVTLRSGEQQVELPMPKLYEFEVHWKGEGKPRIALWPEDTRGAPAWRTVSWDAYVSSEGTAKFDALPAGNYRVKVNGKLAATVDVPDQSEVALP